MHSGCKAAVVLLALCACCIPAASASSWDRDIDSPMFRDPVLPRARVEYTFPKNIAAVWREALERPGADLPCQAALAIAEAHRQGMLGLEPLIEPLRRALDDASRHPSVRLAAAGALIELNARTMASNLFRLAETGDQDLRNLIEPALARWDYQPARAVWLKRLNQRDTPPHALVLAVRGLGLVRQAQAAQPLRKLVFDAQQSAAIRLEAAWALGRIQTAGAESDAQRLLAGGTGNIVRRLAAVALLRHHQGTAGELLLQGLLKDPEPAVVRPALKRLAELDPRVILPNLEPLLANRDAEVRLAAVKVLFQEMTPARLPLLVDRCHDPHPRVRVRARRFLRTLADRPAYRPAIITQVSQLLAGNDWRAQEQAAILLPELGHVPAAPRLVELLDSNRPEVCVAAAWGVRQLDDPAMLPAVLRYVQRPHQDIITFGTRLAPRNAMAGAFDDQMAQLIQFLGKNRYRPAEAILRQFVPKAPPQSRAPVGGHARAAAIWALGLLHENHSDPEVSALVEQPLWAVLTGPNPDDERVFRMCLITLARMRSPAALKLANIFYRIKKPTTNSINNAAGWAVEHITGKPVPHEATEVRTVGRWFLAPLGS
ncbi:MAG TPA: HEAT repeat domain-containing protein [Gemmataceae bacterium]|nr:HEAT repeat domain-containing protein [Gemmataceae bacterium]